MNDMNGLNKRYVAGVDGGGTKTACMIADETGSILGYAVAEGSNHQISGFPLAIENVYLSIRTACAQADISFSQLSFIYLGWRRLCRRLRYAEPGFFRKIRLYPVPSR